MRVYVYVYIRLCVGGKKNSMKGGAKKAKTAPAATKGDTQAPPEGEIVGMSHNYELFRHWVEQEQLLVHCFNIKRVLGTVLSPNYRSKPLFNVFYVKPKLSEILFYPVTTPRNPFYVVGCVLF